MDNKNKSVEEKQKLAEDTKGKVKHEIKDGVDPSMDEMGVLTVSKFDIGADRPSKSEYVIKITRGQYLAGEYEGDAESEWISMEESKKRIVQIGRSLEELLNDKDPDLDEPLVYIETVGYKQTNPYHPKPIEGPVIRSKREINVRVARDGLGFLYEDGRAPKTQREQELAREFKERIDKIKNDDNPELDKRGLVSRSSASQSYVETTLRQAMLCSKNLDPKDIGFKTYEEIIKEQQKEIEEKGRIIRKQQKEIEEKGRIIREQQEKIEKHKKSPITWAGIKKAIRIKNERGER